MSEKWSAGKVKEPTPKEIKESRYNSLQAYHKSVNELKTQIKTLNDEIAGLEKKRGLKNTQIAEEVKRIKSDLRTRQEGLNKLINENRALNRKAKKDIIDAENSAMLADGKLAQAESKRKDALKQIASNNQRIAEERTSIATETANLDDRENALNQAKFELSKQVKELDRRLGKLKKAEADFDNRNSGLKNSEELLKARNEIADKNMAEAAKEKKTAENTQKTADKLMVEANQKMSNALKKEEISTKKEGILKDRDKSLDKLNADLKEKKVSQEEYERYLALLKRETENKIKILNKLRKEEKK